ncbi:Peptidase S1C [Fusarium oxysporum f. sp. vasinfectum]|nr:Peptidase S1C [Fusarium oxysporum f. sp. vasinfectum]
MAVRNLGEGRKPLTRCYGDDYERLPPSADGAQVSFDDTRSLIAAEVIPRHHAVPLLDVAQVNADKALLRLLPARSSSTAQAPSLAGPLGLEHQATSMGDVPSKSEGEAWQEAIKNVRKCVVSIKYQRPCTFDTERCGVGEATGFVVDAQIGLILTNRHVIGPGPFYGSIVFENNEELDVRPIYRDPVHDFGFLKFEPNSVNYMNLIAMELTPGLATVGTEIKVIGNDSGESGSILSGYISRVDRNTPVYPQYTDFNTCYYQANASTSGGSSGSPVFNVDGVAIGLQAGGISNASTDYFLPLDAPQRVLKQIQNGGEVKRGDIQTVFKLKPIFECKRLGLSGEWEREFRKTCPGVKDLIVADKVLPEGPSDGKLKAGDILIKINGKLVIHFLYLNTVFDENVGQTVSVLVQRDGHDIEQDITVQDLSKITPSCFFSFDRTIFHDISYQVAHRYGLACRGVFVSDPGYFLHPIRRLAIINSVNHSRTPNLIAFVEVMREIPVGTPVPIEYWYPDSRYDVETAVVTINRGWSQKLKMFKRNDTTGEWDVEVLAKHSPAVQQARRHVSHRPSTRITATVVAKTMRSLVRVKCCMPLALDGLLANVTSGLGLVIDATGGYIIISRTVVPNTLCDIEVTFAGSLSVPGTVKFHHPWYHYAIIQYDTNLVHPPAESARLSREVISEGQRVFFLGCNGSDEIVHAFTSVTKVIPFEANPPDPPRTRPVNIDKIDVETRLGAECNTGFLIAEDASVQGLWITYEIGEDRDGYPTKEYLGISSHVIAPDTEKLSQGVDLSLRRLPVELRSVTIIDARAIGVSEEWIEKIQDDPADACMFKVERTWGQLPCQFQKGDVLLSLDGNLVTKLSALDDTDGKELLDVVVSRKGQQITFKAHTILEDDFETTELISFDGLVVQKPHRTVRQSIEKLPSEVYVTCTYRGSPANAYHVTAMAFITHIDSKPVTSLQPLTAMLSEISQDTHFKMDMVEYSGNPSFVTMKKNERFFPLTVWSRDQSESKGWKRITYENGMAAAGEGRYGFSM